MSLTSSQSQNITSPNGNSLAVFIDGVTGIMMLKDINGKTEPLSNYVCSTPAGNSPFEYGTGGNSSIKPILGSNVAFGENDTVGGGSFNTANGSESTISGGIYNDANGNGSFIGGGICNSATGNKSIIVGGCCNISSNQYSTIGGGSQNIASDYQATIGGGGSNVASNISSVVSGGRSNIASGQYSTIGGGYSNNSSGNYSIIGGGCNNTASTYFSTVGGGLENIASGYGSIIGGGRNNIVSGQYSMVGGGYLNSARCCFTSIIGGQLNDTCSFCNVIISGSNLCATQNCTTFMNCASVDNLTAGCVVRVGTNKVLENSFSKIGSFFSTQTQCATTINTPKAMTLNNTDAFTSGVSIVSNSQITVDTAGIYNLQFSAQVDRVTTSGVDLIEIWFRKQGVDIPNSTTKVTVSGSANQAKVVASWNFYLSLTAGQYVELMYSVTDLQVRLVAEAENLAVPYPATPSLIVTIQKIN
jgi:hypothetical protein